MIVSWLRFHPEDFNEWNVKTHDWVDLPYEPNYEWEMETFESRSFHYRGTWAHFFDRFATLPHLVDFRFDVADEEREYGVKLRENCRRDIDAERYTVFDGVIVPPWGDPDWHGEMESWVKGGFSRNMHKEELEADRQFG